MSLVEELAAKVPQLNQQELAKFRAWFEGYIEDPLELREAVKAELDQPGRKLRKVNSTLSRHQQHGRTTSAAGLNQLPAHVQLKSAQGERTPDLGPRKDTRTRSRP